MKFSIIGRLVKLDREKLDNYRIFVKLWENTEKQKICGEHFPMFNYIVSNYNVFNTKFTYNDVMEYDTDVCDDANMEIISKIMESFNDTKFKYNNKIIMRMLLDYVEHVSFSDIYTFVKNHHIELRCEYIRLMLKLIYSPQESPSPSLYETADKQQLCVTIMQKHQSIPVIKSNLRNAMIEKYSKNCVTIGNTFDKCLNVAPKVMHDILLDYCKYLWYGERFIPNMLRFIGFFTGKFATTEDLSSVREIVKNIFECKKNYPSCVICEIMEIKKYEIGYDPVLSIIHIR